VLVPRSSAPPATAATPVAPGTHRPRPCSSSADASSDSALRYVGLIDKSCERQGCCSESARGSGQPPACGARDWQCRSSRVARTSAAPAQWHKTRAEIAV